MAVLGKEEALHAYLPRRAIVLSVEALSDFVNGLKSEDGKAVFSLPGVIRDFLKVGSSNLKALAEMKAVIRNHRVENDNKRSMNNGDEKLLPFPHAVVLAFRFPRTKEKGDQSHKHFRTYATRIPAPGPFCAATETAWAHQ